MTIEDLPIPSITQLDSGARLELILLRRVERSRPTLSAKPKRKKPTKKEEAKKARSMLDNLTHDQIMSLLSKLEDLANA